MPLCAFASTLSFSPSVGSYEAGSVFSVGVYVGNNETALNAVSGVINFPQDLLEVTSVSKNQSILSLWVQEPSFSNSAGRVNFEGIIPNPGFSGSSGKVITVTFRVKAQGSAPLSFSSGSILANDGEGTELLSKKSTAVFTLTPEVSVPLPVAVVEENETQSQAVGVPNTPNIGSLTHPYDQWSSQVVGLFNFDIEKNVTALRLLLDTQPSSTPTIVYEPALVSREISDLEEGVSYLHVQFRNSNGWGEINHYKLQIDTQKPTELTVTEVTDSQMEGKASFVFDASDERSGIERYEVALSGHEIESFAYTEQFTYTTPELEQGTYMLEVKAFDMAGNFVSSTVQFSITGAQLSLSTVDETPPTSLDKFLKKGGVAIAVLSVVVPFIALLLLLCALLYSIWKAHGGMKKRVAKETLEAKMIMYKAFALLRKDLQDDIATLEKAHTKRKLTKEEAKIMKRLKTNIDQAEQVLSKEIGDIEKELH